MTTLDDEEILETRRVREMLTFHAEERREAMLTAKIPNALELNRTEARAAQTGLF